MGSRCCSKTISIPAIGCRQAPDRLRSLAGLLSRTPPSLKICAQAVQSFSVKRISRSGQTFAPLNPPAAGPVAVVKPIIPTALDRNPCGSSAGSGAAASANFATVSLGSETDGSIVCPGNANGVVAIKPTVGLVSRAGVVPISHTQDTVGPHARTVADAAATLGVIQSRDLRWARSRHRWRAARLAAHGQNSSQETFPLTTPSSSIRMVSEARDLA